MAAILKSTSSGLTESPHICTLVLKIILKMLVSQIFSSKYKHATEVKSYFV